MTANEAELADKLQNKSAKKKARKIDAASASDEDHSPPKDTKHKIQRKEVSVEKAKVRIWFSRFASASIPISLEALTTNNMFSLITKAWEFKLNDEKVNCAVASFPWLREDSNILFVRDNNNDTAFEVMLEQVRNSPTWKESGSCSFDLQIHV